MTLHCLLHCPKDCALHSNWPHHHVKHCAKTCHLHIKTQPQEEVMEESKDGEEVVYDPDPDHIYLIHEVDENKIYHDNISCDSCGIAIVGPVYHRDPQLDYCQSCVQKGVPGAEFCLCYVVCCGYYGKGEGGVFSTWENYYG